MRADRFVECLTSYLGITEVPDGSNSTPIGREFGWDRVSWCCEEQSLGLCGAKWNGHGFDYDGGFWDGQKLVIPGVGPGDYRKGWAAVPSIVAAFKRAGLAGSEPRYPCLMAFRWSADPMDSHIGAAIHPGSVITIEGNHRNRCEQWSRDPHNQVWAYLYPPWDDSPAPKPRPSPTVLEEDDMPSGFIPADGEPRSIVLPPGQRFIGFGAEPAPGANRDTGGTVLRVVAGGGPPNVKGGHWDQENDALYVGAPNSAVIGLGATPKGENAAVAVTNHGPNIVHFATWA